VVERSDTTGPAFGLAPDIGGISRKKAQKSAEGYGCQRCQFAYFVPFRGWNL